LANDGRKTMRSLADALEKLREFGVFSDDSRAPTSVDCASTPGARSGPVYEQRSPVLPFHRAAFSASSRLIGLNGETTSLKRKKISATIVADVT
jgi:hypothetical protein